MMCHITYINNPRWSASYHIYSVNTSFVNLLVGTAVAMSLIRSKNKWLEASTRLSNELWAMSRERWAVRSGSGWKPALFIDGGHNLSASELSMLFLRWCRGVTWSDASRIQLCFHLSMIFNPNCTGRCSGKDSIHRWRSWDSSWWTHRVCFCRL